MKKISKQPSSSRGPGRRAGHKGISSPESQRGRPTRHSKAVKERLLEQTEQLFYENGFYRTGLREIISRAKAVPASFYNHFASKDDLGLAYLERQEQQMHDNLLRMMEMYPDVRSFLRAWTLAKRKDVRDGVFLGCPFAGFSYQSGVSEPKHQAFIQAASDRWVQLLTDYIRQSIQAGFLKKDTPKKELARRILIFYQGSVSMWKQSGSLDYWRDMQALMLNEVNRYAV